ncbi:MAG: hypothetical protein EKK47_14080 [Burkholderiales bacterium]|nr:MAG: hypothetical protein EKK47_14080 [Burkholderiales bacterium]
MPRCLKSVTAALALIAPALAFSQSAVLGASASASSSTTSTPDSKATLSNSTGPAGRAIPIPVQTLRGEITFGLPPEVKLNGSAARLAPGARIRNEHNLLTLSGNLIGQTYKVNYTIDTYGLLMNVWLLTADEANQLWPTTAKEAATWTYDPVSHIWVKP